MRLLALRSKIPPAILEKAIQDVLTYSNETKKRKFVETVELQISLKNYDPQRDKRFSGSIRLPLPCKKSMKFCILGDAVHCEVAEKLKIDSRDIEALKQFNRNKKLVKKLGTYCCCTVLRSAALPFCGSSRSLALLLLLLLLSAPPE